MKKIFLAYLIFCFGGALWLLVTAPDIKNIMNTDRIHAVLIGLACVLGGIVVYITERDKFESVK